MKSLCVMPFALCAALTPAFANDSYGGLTATGLVYDTTGAVSMDQENLYISPSKISVEYVFKNNTDKPVSGEVIFPIPPIAPLDLYHSPSTLADKMDMKNPVNFTVTVDGTPVAANLDMMAVMDNSDISDNNWARFDYTVPGLNVSPILEAYNIPYDVDIEAVSQHLKTLPKEELDKLIAAGLVSVEEGEDLLFPQWNILMRYHWPQEFGAGQEVKVSHNYDNNPGGHLVVGGQSLASDTEMLENYCINADGIAAIDALIKKANPDTPADESIAFGHDTFYILRSANSWAGPIRDFRLTVDSETPEQLAFFCGENAQKTGDTTYVIERKDFAPTEDLAILFVSPKPIE